MFRRTSLAVVGFTVLGCAGTPQVDMATEVAAVRKRFADWVEAEERRDLEASLSFLTADAIIQGEGAPAMKGVEAARAVWQGFFAIPYTDILDVEPRTVAVSRSGDLAYDIGSWKLVVPGKNGATEEHGKSTIVWEKRDGQWKAVALSFSMDRPPPPPAPTVSTTNR